MRSALDLIRVYGVDGAKARVVNPIKRELIDTAARFYDTEPTVGVTSSGFCVVRLPPRGSPQQRAVGAPGAASSLLAHHRARYPQL